MTDGKVPAHYNFESIDVMKTMTLPIWIGIAVCISQSAMLSGLNLAFFTISKLELHIDDDVILMWGEDKRIITGADILGRLLRGIVSNPASKKIREEGSWPKTDRSARF